MSDTKETGVDFSGESSDGLVVDLSDVQGGFDPMPKGMYPCEVTELEFTYSQSSGNPMWAWTLEVAEGEFAGRKLFFYTVFAGDGLGITKATLARVAPNLAEQKFSPADVANSGDMLGMRVQARVGQQKYEGEIRNNVRGLFAAGEGGSNFM